MNQPLNRHSENPVLKAAKHYVRNGICVTPVPYRSKRAYLGNWQNTILVDGELEKHFNQPNMNIGILLGEASGGLIDIDLDCKEAVNAAQLYLPNTVIQGRAGNPNSHYYFKVNGSLKTEKFQDPLKVKSSDKEKRRKAMLLEIRSDGTQTVAPPSVHESGEQIKYVGDLKPPNYTVIEAAELRKLVGKIAAASLLARYWHTVSRNQATLSLAGGLMNNGWIEEEVKRFVAVITTIAGDEEPHDRIRAVEATFKARANGSDITGFPTLASEFDERIISKVMDWLQIGQHRSMSRPQPIEFQDPIIPGDRPKTKPFPIHALPENLQEYCKQVAAAYGVPAELVGCNLLVMCSIAIGNRRKVLVNPGTDDVQKAILWIIIVARKGSGKSPVQNETMKPLWHYQTRLLGKYEHEMEEYQLELDKWEANAKKNKKAGTSTDPAPKKPIRQDIMTNDATIEALARLLENNPRGVLAAFDEFLTFYRSLNAYRGGLGGDKEKYLSLWNGSPLKIDRVDETKSQYVSDTLVSIIGNMTPSGLPLISEGTNRDDGFIDRFLFAFPQDVPMMEWKTDVSVDSKIKQAYYDTMNSLFYLEDKTIPLSHEARQLGANYYNHQLIPEAGDDENKRGIFTKLRTYLNRIALIIHVVESQSTSLSREKSGAEEISASTMKKAIELVEYFKDQSSLIFETFVTGTFDKNVRKAIVWLQKQVQAGKNTVSFRDIYRNANITVNEGELVADELIENQFIAEIERRKSPNGFTIIYAINPKIASLVVS